MCASDQPGENLGQVLRAIEQAAGKGADLICTPEVSNCVSLDRTHQSNVLCEEAQDASLPNLQAAARRCGLWVAVGSLALKGGSDGRFLNRSFLIAPSGEIFARYDKIHMFDVSLGRGETYHESSGYAPGNTAVLARTPLANIGLTICYDLRFAHLYRTLAKAGAEVFLVPAAFSPTTGAAHWETLLRARAIETGAYVVAAAQTGRHSATNGRARETYGHSMVVSPWGEVVLDSGKEPGLFCVDIDLAQVAEARRRVPSLTHDRSFLGP